MMRTGWVLVGWAALAACGGGDDGGASDAAAADAQPGDAASTPDAASDATIDAAADAAGDAAIDATPLSGLTVHVDGVPVASWSCGDRGLGTATTIAFTVGNHGLAAVAIAPTLLDADPAYGFDGAATTCLDGPTAVDASCVVAVRFAPVVVGDVTATLALSADDLATVAIAITGRGVVDPPALMAPRDHRSR